MDELGRSCLSNLVSWIHTFPCWWDRRVHSDAECKLASSQVPVEMVRNQRQGMATEIA